MKLLLETTDDAYIDEVQQLLEANGIPVFISNKDTLRVMSHVNAIKEGLWIYIDKQEGDAISLLQDPNHIVSAPVDIDEFYKKANRKQSYLPIISSLSGANTLFIAVLACLVLWILITQITT